jgi:transcriptional regulator with XRE-family HTH domain
MYGDVIRRARQSRGLTQAELAEISGVDQPNVSAIENGKRQPSAATLHQLLLACGYELLAAAGDKVIPLPASPDDAPGGAPVAPATPLTAKQRTRAVVAALDAAEAIVRGK